MQLRREVALHYFDFLLPKTLALQDLYCVQY